MNETATQEMLRSLDLINDILERIALALEQIALELPTTQDGLPALTGARDTANEEAPSYSANLSQWVCPIHGSWKMVPAGVSRKTGKPYAAFMACSSPGCNEKPPRFAVLP